MENVNTPGSAEMLAAREASKGSVAFGAVLSVLGIFAVLAPMFTGVAVTTLVGLLLLGAGIVEMVFALKAKSFGKGALKFLFGGLGILAGLVIIATPVASLSFLTIWLAAFFVIGGVLDIVLGLKLRPVEGWGWMLFGGIVSLAVAALVVSQWPVSGIWAVGLYVGIRMMMHGWMLMAIGKTGQETLTHLQDTRIEMLEHHVRAGARALQQAQAALAEHSAMLAAIESGLREKVSFSEVDPAIRELNQELGVAREHMHRAAKATTEAWHAAQKDANVAFDKLQRDSEELTERLKLELGLGVPDKV